MSTDKDWQLEALYGPLAAYSEYAKGASITYCADGLTHTGVIVWVVGPHTTPGGCSRPMYYVVERDGVPDSMPDVIHQSDIVE
jgi:hypothetical protein